MDGRKVAVFNSCHPDQIQDIMNDDGAKYNVFSNAPMALVAVSVKAAVGKVTLLHEVYEALRILEQSNRPPSMERIDEIIFE